MHCQKQPSLIQIGLSCDLAPSVSSPGPAGGNGSVSDASLLPLRTTKKSVSADVPYS